MKTIHLILLTVLIFQFCSKQPYQGTLTPEEKNALFTAIENDTIFASGVKDTSNAIRLYEHYKEAVAKSDSAWKQDQKRLDKIKAFGYTSKFELIPLVEGEFVNKDFRKAGGVSYLVRTDHATILFDTGIDDDTVACAFRYNLDMLGIDITEIDYMIISHNHGDHQNGWKWMHDKTFINQEGQNIVGDIDIYVPEDNLGLDIPALYTHDPIQICEGVYTTGIIEAPLFFAPTQEQGLIINVKGKGLVVVTGCGHQTMEKLVQRCQTLSDIPLYGILGGMHYPIEGDFHKYMGYFITGKLPWEPFTQVDVDEKVRLMQKQDIQLIGISAHDSSPGTIEAFKTAFATRYTDIKAGDRIYIN